MDKKRFRELADAYGADVARWPAGDAAAARTLLDGADGGWARAVLEDVVGTDALLDAYELDDSVDAALAARIVATATALPQDPVETTDRARGGAKTGGGIGAILSDALGFRVRPAWVFAPGGGLMAAAVIGFFIGAGGMMPGAQQDALLLDPVFYSQDELVMPDAELWLGMEEGSE